MRETNRQRSLDRLAQCRELGEIKKKIRRGVLGKLLSVALGISSMGLSSGVAPSISQIRGDRGDQRSIMLPSNSSFRFKSRDLGDRQLININLKAEQVIFELTQTLTINGIRQVVLENGAVGLVTEGKVFFCNGQRFFEVKTQGEVQDVDLTSQLLFIISRTQSTSHLAVYHATGNLFYRLNDIPFPNGCATLADNSNTGALLIVQKGRTSDRSSGQNSPEELVQNRQPQYGTAEANAGSTTNEIFQFKIINPNGVVASIEYNSPFEDLLLFPERFNGSSVTFKGYERSNLNDLNYRIVVNLKDGRASRVSIPPEPKPVIQFYPGKNGQTVITSSRNERAPDNSAIPGLETVYIIPTEINLNYPLVYGWAPSDLDAISKTSNFFAIGLTPDGKAVVFCFEQVDKNQLEQQHLRNEVLKKLDKTLREVTKDLVQKRNENGIDPESEEYDKFTDDEIEYVRSLMRDGFQNLEVVVENNNGLQIVISAGDQVIAKALMPGPNRYRYIFNENN